MVRQAVRAMPDHLRSVLLLVYFNGFAYKDTAEILGIPVGTVKSRIHAAIAELGRRLGRLREQT